MAFRLGMLKLAVGRKLTATDVVERVLKVWEPKTTEQVMLVQFLSKWPGTATLVKSNSQSTAPISHTTEHPHSPTPQNTLILLHHRTPSFSHTTEHPHSPTPQNTLILPHHRTPSFSHTTEHPHSPTPQNTLILPHHETPSFTHTTEHPHSPTPQNTLILPQHRTPSFCPI